ncbi:MAG: hypothetical protein H8M99_11260 [Gloeobacteraceae cyanobacterium ES-bin-144]|nr:hypothetical protein [Verrucomicrobiales bacterium]
MRLHFHIISWFATLVIATAEPQALPDNTVSSSSRETVLNNLLSERDSPAALDRAIAAARKIGISEQAILEARFLYHIDHNDDDAIVTLLPEFLKQRDAYKIENTAVFNTKDDWLAVIEYVQAIDAMKKGDKDAFKRHITEAFWLSPQQAAAFAPQIQRMRLEEAMRSVKIDFTLKLLPVVSGDAVSLETLIENKKALLFHFWSPASRECEASLPDFAATAITLSSNDIAVVSLIPDDTPKFLADSRGMLQSLGVNRPDAWLIDSKEKPLGRDLRIQNLPTMVLISTDGKVLFNGDPTDEEFWEKLKSIDAKIVRPNSTSEKTK